MRVGGRLPVVRTSAREEDHVRWALLETRRIGAENKHWPCRSVTDQSNSRPDVNCLGYTVAPRRNENNSLSALLFDGVDGRLQCCRIVGDTVGLDGKVFGGEINGFGIVQAGGEGGSSEQRRGPEHGNTCKQFFPHRPQ